MLDYKLKVPTDREGLKQLLTFLELQKHNLSILKGEQLYVFREVDSLIKLLQTKIKGLAKPKSITLNVFQLESIKYCYFWFSTGLEITELPQFMQLISKIISKKNVSNIIYN